MKVANENFTFYNGVILYPLMIVMTIWFVFWVEFRFGLDFTTWGVKPRTVLGIRGILFSPFIHSGMSHLWHNTVPILVLSSALFYFYKQISWKVLGWVVLLSGLGTWLIGRDSYHIGISGVIYGLAAFLFFKGIKARHYRLMALSFIVVFLYGSLVWGTLPLKEGISWEGHLSGFVAGIVLGLFSFRESIPEPPKYKWEREDYNEEEDPFMQQFDENGNFFELEPDDDEIQIEYDYKESPNDN